MHKLRQDILVSPHFSRSEFACKCGCGFSTPDPELVHVLEDLRRHFNKPVTINSACRCESHNKRVDGASNSAHLFGIAADVVVKDVPPAAVYAHLNGELDDCYGIGSYTTFTHIDVRDNKARW